MTSHVVSDVQPNCILLHKRSPFGCVFFWGAPLAWRFKRATTRTTTQSWGSNLKKDEPPIWAIDILSIDVTSEGLVALNEMDALEGPAFECWPGTQHDEVFCELQKGQGARGPWGVGGRRGRKAGGRCHGTGFCSQQERGTGIGWVAGGRG